VLEALNDAVLRPAAGVGYTTDEARHNLSQGAPHAAVEQLVEAIRAQLDPNRVLAV
jgi:hypothetical protein